MCARSLRATKKKKIELAPTPAHAVRRNHQESAVVDTTRLQRKRTTKEHHWKRDTGKELCRGISPVVTAFLTVGLLSRRQCYHHRHHHIVTLIVRLLLR